MRRQRQADIEASISRQAEQEILYDQPFEDKSTVRVTGPFTVESLSPHRVLGVDENDELIDRVAEPGAGYGEKQTFPQMILENLKTAGVQQAHKEDRITFTALTAWPGDLVCAEGRYLEGEAEKRAAIFIGPEFGTVQRAVIHITPRSFTDHARFPSQVMGSTTLANESGLPTGRFHVIWRHVQASGLVRPEPKRPCRDL